MPRMYLSFWYICFVHSATKRYLMALAVSWSPRWMASCSNCYKIKFVRAVACTPSFTCAPHSRVQPLQPRLRETLSECPLQTLHYYDISIHHIGPKQTVIRSPTQRLLTGTWDATIGWTFLVVPRQKVILP